MAIYHTSLFLRIDLRALLQSPVWADFLKLYNNSTAIRLSQRELEQLKITSLLKLKFTKKRINNCQLIPLLIMRMPSMCIVYQLQGYRFTTVLYNVELIHV